MNLPMEPVKLVVAGPSGAGKSTLVRAIADLTVRSSDPTGVVFDLGRITIGRDLILYLYGAPSEPESGDGWAAISTGMLASIVVVDALRPDGPVHALPHVRWFASQDAPVLIAGNRCPPEATPVLARELGVDPAVVVALDCSVRSEVRNLVVATLEAALTAANPTVVSMEIQARLS